MAKDVTLSAKIFVIEPIDSGGPFTHDTGSFRRLSDGTLLTSAEFKTSEHQSAEFVSTETALTERLREKLPVLDVLFAWPSCHVELSVSEMSERHISDEDAAEIINRIAKELGIVQESTG